MPGMGYDVPSGQRLAVRAIACADLRAHAPVTGRLLSFAAGGDRHHVVDARAQELPYPVEPRMTSQG